MEKIKTGIIFIITILLAFESGILFIGSYLTIGFMKALNDEREASRKQYRRVSYRDYYGRRES